MSYGEKIVELRKSKNMTQAALGAELNVTYQAVSKWERDESDPDFATMCKIARLFGVPLTYFEATEGEASEEKAEGETSPEEAPEEAAAETPEESEESEAADEKDAAPVVMPERLIGVCSVCGKSIYDQAELGERSPKLVCKSCQTRIAQEKTKAEQVRLESERRKRAYALEGTHKTRNRGLIAAALIVGGLLIMGIIGSIMTKTEALYAILGSLTMLVFLYPFVAQLFWGGIVQDVCLTGGKWIGMPGVIFSLDLDGIIFLIVIKIIFAVIRFFVFILILLFFVVVAMVISPFTFIPQLLKLNRGEEL